MRSDRKTMKLGDKEIGGNNPVFIIGEIGVNHNGEIEIAKKLIDSAKEAEVDCVKFQTFVSDDMISTQAPLAKYQETTSNAKTQHDLVKKLELSKEFFYELKKYAENVGLFFLSTPFDFKSVELLSDLGVEAFKISSGEINNRPFLEKIVSFHKPIILSTGTSDLNEIRQAVTWISQKGCENFSLLQCTSSYPTEVSDCNLLTIPLLFDEFGVPIGFSDHTKDSLSAIVSVGLGAKIIEKHITLDRKMEGPDHSTSLPPDELKMFVQNIRDAEKALGNGIKSCLPCEMDVRMAARKSIVAIKPILKGKKIELKDIGIKRPGTGIEPKFYYELVGKRVSRDMKFDEILTWEDIEKN